MAPRRGADDVYGQSDIASAAYSITFIVTTADEIVQKGKTPVYLFASWCTYCLAHLRQQRKTGNRGAVYVSSNYDCKSMNRLFMNNIDTICILSNKHYGSVESQKIKKYSSELPGEESSLTGVTQQFIKDGNQYIRFNFKN